LPIWIRNVVLEEDHDQLKRTYLLQKSPAKATTTAAADIAKATQELLTSKTEGRLIKLQYGSCKISYICVNTPNFH